MCQCFSKFLVGIMSCITIGLCLAASIAALVLVLEKDIQEASKTVEICLIVAVVITGIIFIFSLYASCCGNKCARNTLATIFVIFTVILVIVAGCAWGLQKQLVDKIGEVWMPGDTFNADAIEKLQNSFECCGFNSSLLCPPNSKRCKEPIEDGVELIANVLGSIFVIVSVFLIICVILLCVNCVNEKVSNDDMYP